VVDRRAGAAGCGIDPKRARRRRSLLVAVAVVVAACGGGDEGAVPTLTWYVFDEPSGAYDEAARDCTEQAGGRYRIEMAALPSSADQQREQLVRRLAAEDADIDIMGMDVIWTGEFAEAGWLQPWAGEAAVTVTDGVPDSIVASATYEDRLWVAPYTTNTQLLWYRTDRVPEPPETWEEMVNMAEAIGPEGIIQVQGARYEGLTVWANSLIASAGGSVITGQGDDAEVALGQPAIRAMEVMRNVATSQAADASLSNAMEDQGRLAFESGGSSFMVNYPFVYPSAEENAPEIFENMGWARWPAVVPGEPSRPPLGGINLGIGAFSEHPELAFEAAACIRSAPHQVIAAVDGGLAPTISSLFDTPEVQAAFPFADLLQESLQDAAPRPVSPAYNDISLAIQRALHPPDSIRPEEDLAELEDKVNQALESRGLL
jgi:multiple sugar transport system substrate-binding protein